MSKRRQRRSLEQIVTKLRDADAMLNAGQDLPADRTSPAGANWACVGASHRT
ncbi:MAG: hypothetical protein KF774_13505 [Planctomyces sp.]|nr:hypothetical protein [Planctomyces sp.]